MPRKGFTAFTKTHPDLAAQWHPVKNGVINPGDLASGSPNKIWWKCPGGPDHEWQSELRSRVRSSTHGQGCPFCAGKRVSVTNSIESQYPDLSEEWHPLKNGALTPDKTVAGYTKNVWWKCCEGPDHEWEAKPESRIRGTGCPYCAGHRVSITNCVATVNPKISDQWHPTKNDPLTPDTTVAGSRVRVWWKCPKSPDHEWEAAVSSRTVNNRGCPYCAGRRVSITNSLEVLAPTLAGEWHRLKNGLLDPSDVRAGTHTKWWWKCPEGPDHEWQATMNNRVKNGSGCPYCAGKKVSVTNSLQLTFPEVARELHPSKNGDLTGDMVTFGTHQKVWWKCPQGPDHEWEMTVNERTNSAQQQGCPFCSGKRLSVTNSLIRLHPHVAKEWHPQKNSNLNLEQITVGTHQKVWWKCPDGTDHEWRTAVRERAAGTGCPFCAGHLVSVTNSLARVNPEIAKEWHPSKNRELTPDDVTSGTHKKVWWQCLDNGHEWPAPVHGRTGRDGTRCPACSLASRSVQEITLAFEILLFIDFDVDDRKVEISGKFLEGDMVLRSLSLVLEFDGSYYHKGEELHARDVQKTTTLTDAGWTVLRVREDPLRPISLHDLLVPKISDMKPVVNATLLQIEQLFEVRLEGLSGYLAESNLKNETARDRYIKKLLKGQKLRSET